MKKSLIIFFILITAIVNIACFNRPKKLKCKKPIYFFENIEKNELFDSLDELSQEQLFQVKKFYPELGFMSIQYGTKYSKTTKQKEPVIVSFDIKQFGNDAYLFIDIDRGNTSLEDSVYKKLKPLAKNSYLLRNDLFCTEFTKDVKSINRNKKIYMQETQYNPSVYIIDMHRYVGYDKKTYFWNKIKGIFSKKENKKENNNNL